MAVQRYRFAKDYSSGRGIWTAGQEIDVEPDEAGWFNRDVPGCLVDAEEADKQAQAAAAAKRIAMLDDIVKAKAGEEAAAKAKAKIDEEERAIEAPPHDRMVKKPESRRGT